MKKTILAAISAFLFSGLSLQAQSFNMTYQGSDTTQSCNGFLYDNGGPSGNYSSYSDDYFYINTGGSSISISFNSFYTQSYYDIVYIYDGMGTSGTLIGSYSGSSLPNSGNPITVPSGSATIYFYSNSYTAYSGFGLTWVTTGGGAPTASFAVNTTPAYNTPVQFFNASTNGNTYLWEFGDGATSTKANPTHNYTVAGPVQARLITTNCTGSDTSAYQTINVQAAPIGYFSTDTVTVTIPCGSSNSTSFTVADSGSGALSYGLTLSQLGVTPVFDEGFESGTIGQFTNLNTYDYTTTISSNNAPQGSYYLNITGSGYSNSGVTGSFNPSTPESFSFRVRDNYYGYHHGGVHIGSGTTYSNFDFMFYSEFNYNDLNLYYTDQYGYQIHYSLPRTQGTWYYIEVKNIDYLQHTFDIYADGNLLVTSAHFIDNQSSIDEILFYSSQYGDVDVDDFHFGPKGLLNNITYNPKSGSLTNGSSNVIFINADATGLVAGTYWFQFNVSSNDTVLDGMTIPLRMEVVGTANLNQSVTCLNFNTVYTGINAQDSVLLWNTGCDTLDFSTVSTTNSDITASASSLKIAPDDSATLFIDINANIAGSYADTVYLSGPDTNSYVCITGQAMGAPAISTDSTSYNVYYTGCSDTVTIPFKIYNTGQSGLNWSASSNMTSNISDDFESSTINTSIWSNWNSGVYLGNSCGVISGSQSLIFYGTGSARYIYTVPINTNNGGTISFNMDQGTCETADLGEGIDLDYSLNGGLTWNNINNYYTTSSLAVNEPIPSQAQGNNVMFRLDQVYNSGSTFDNWIVDDFSITSSVSNSIVFAPDTGVVSIGDSISVDAKIGASGLITGTYNFQANITSNDPLNPIYSFPITLHLTGVPDIVVPTTCMDMDSAMTGASNTDSIMVLNDGCGDLILSSLTTSTSDFTVLSGLDTVSPGDTSYIKVQFTGSSSLGLINDTLSITSNDTLAKVCLTGVSVGAPNASIVPDSIYTSFTSCNDSVTIPVKIYNTGGNALLTYKVKGGVSNAQRNILSIAPNYTYTEYQNVSSILNSDPKNHLIEDFSSSLSTLQTYLDSADLVLIPENSYGSIWSQASSDLQSYCNQGGTIIILLNANSILQDLNLIPGYNGTFGIYSTLTNHDPNHPIMNGVSSSFYYSNATQSIYHNSTGEVLLNNNLSAANSPSVVSVFPQGLGKVIYIGFDYYQYSTETSAILTNAVAWGAKPSIPDYLKIAPDSGAVAINDSAVINVTISSVGLKNGNYNGSFVLETNDPQNPEIIVPYSFDISGNPEITLPNNTGCLSYSSVMQGATSTDSVMVINTGCDTLNITGFTGNSTEFGISNLPMSLAPGDSSQLFVTFNPATVGTFSDTLSVLNNDTTVTICVTGTSVGAPVLTIDSDTLKVTLNKCKVIKNVNYLLQNTGLASLTYDIAIGDYSGASQIAYNTAGATTTHTFTGVPSSDTLMLKVILNGDYDDYYERTYLTIDGSYYYGSIYDNNLNHVNDTIDLLFYGSNVQTWTSDGQLDIELQNSYDVDGSAGSFHRVEVFLPASISWVSVVGSTSGSILAGASATKNLLFNAAALSVGSYYTTMNITSNAPGIPNVKVPIELDVVSKPEMTIKDSCLLFPMTLLNDTTTKSFYVKNTGCTTLNISSIVSSSGAFKVSPTTGSIAADDSLQITVDFIPTVAQTYNANMVITSNDSVRVLCMTGVAAALPVAHFGFSYENSCKGSVAFSDNSQNSPTSYLWNFGDGLTSTQPLVTHNYAKAGTYKVVLKVTNSAGFDTISKTVTVNPLYVYFEMTNDTVLQGTTVSFYDSSAVPIDWNWNFGDGSTSTLQNPTHNYPNLGKYQITLQVDDANGCNRDTTRDLYVVDHIGLVENTIDGHSFNVYPNPSDGVFNLECNGLDLTNYELVISSMTGQVVKRINPEKKHEVAIEMKGLSPGMYHLTILRSGQMKGNKKLILR